MDLRRPQRGTGPEAEAELLRLQDEFLQRRTESAARVIRVEPPAQNHGEATPTPSVPSSTSGTRRSPCVVEHPSREPRSDHTQSVVAAVVRERDVSQLDVVPPSSSGRGCAFPPALHRSQVTFGIRKREKEKEKGIASRGPKEEEGDALHESIHRENVERLERMSLDEIHAAREEVLRSVDPQIVDLVRKRAQQRTEGTFQDSAPHPAETESLDQAKLEWTLPPEEETEKDEASDDVIDTMRFALEGHLMNPNDEVPSHAGLHHHGDQATRPGYTIRELLRLARSSVAGQRALALGVLGKILANVKVNESLDASTASSLVRPTVLLILRVGIDDTSSSVLQQGLEALHALVVSQGDEDLLDALDLLGRGLEVIPMAIEDGPDAKSVDGDRSQEEEILAADLIMGLLHTNVVNRLRFVLEVLQPHHHTKDTADKILDLLIRIARHSLSCANAVARCPRLMDVIRQEFIADTPSSRAIKLIRVLCTAGRDIAHEFVHNGLIDATKRFLVGGYGSDGRPEAVCHGTSVHGDLCLEALRLWRVVLFYGLDTGSFVDLYAVLADLGMLDEGSRWKSFVSMVECADTEALQCTTSRARVALLVCASGIRSAACGGLSWTVVHPIASAAAELAQRVILVGNQVHSHAIRNALRGMFAATCHILSAYYQFWPSQAPLHYSASTAIPILESLWQKTVLPLVDDYIIPSVIPELPDAEALRACTRNGELGLGRFSSHISWTRGASCIPPGASLLVEAMEVVDSLLGFTSWMAAIVDLHRGLAREGVDDLVHHLHSYVRSLRGVESVFQSYPLPFFFRPITLLLFQMSKLLYHLSHSLELRGTIHDLAVSLVAVVVHGDESLMEQLLSHVIFNPEYLGAVMRGPWEDGSPWRLRIDGTRLRTALLDFMGSLLISTTARDRSRSRDQGDVSHIEGFLLSRHSSLLPAALDWVFYPITETIQGELGELVEATLQFVALLERTDSTYMASLPLPTRLCRILQVFTKEGDLFREPPINALLGSLFNHYTRRLSGCEMGTTLEATRAVDFNALFLDLVNQFSAGSYGDRVFACVLRWFLRMEFAPHLRRTILSELSEVLHLLAGDPVGDPLGYLAPLEKDEEVLRLYVAALSGGHLTMTTCGFLYVVALHHLSAALFRGSLIGFAGEALLLRLLTVSPEPAPFRDLFMYHPVSPAEDLLAYPWPDTFIPVKLDSVQRKILCSLYSNHEAARERIRRDYPELRDIALH